MSVIKHQTVKTLILSVLTLTILPTQQKSGYISVCTAVNHILSLCSEQTARPAKQRSTQVWTRSCDNEGNLAQHSFEGFMRHIEVNVKH